MAREYRVVATFSDDSVVTVFHATPVAKIRSANEPLSDAARRARAVGALREIGRRRGEGEAITRTSGAYPVKARIESREAGEGEWEREPVTRAEFLGRS